uniref:protein-tyrosine-phosphatase n=1 Tax=Glossina brevipalpis TaxID=37001 RepID=A0A1A9WB74_9MUSC
MCFNFSFQIPRPGSVRRLNMDSSMHDMVIDELSFYDDDGDDDDETTTQERVFNASPPLMSLLPPENSPQRFQVVERSKPLQARNFNVSASKSDRPQKSDSTSASTKTPPAKAFRILQSLSSGSTDSSLDDEYKEFFEMESLDQPQLSFNYPCNMHSLISGRIIKNSPPKPLETRRPSARRCLSMNENVQPYHEPKTPEATAISGVISNNSNSNTPFTSRLNNSCGFKRPDPPSNSCSPIQPKRQRNAEKENLDGSLNGCTTSSKGFALSNPPIPNIIPACKLNVPLPATASVRRCISMNDAEIMSALARFDNKDEPDLIGDFSKPYLLPLVEGRHRDLKSISCSTVAHLLRGEYDDKIANYKIIDCRYPYEFDGGHIRGAKNLYTQEQIIEEFPSQKKSNKESGDANKRNIIIFHCEFSSERGPKLSRFLRNHDRTRNTNSYPALDYPEVYLLHNGYKEFFENYSELCEPHTYRPMLEPSYSKQYRHFRSKSKSWNSNGDGTGGGTTQRSKKPRSRLVML